VLGLVTVNETRIQAQVVGFMSSDNKWNTTSGTGIRC